MTKDEAIEKAIDFLDGSYAAHAVRKALQDALAQPQPAQEWVGLSYEEADGLITQHQHAPFKFVRAIEQSLKEKNYATNI